MGQVDWTPELVRGKTETSFGVRALNPGLIRVNKFSGPGGSTRPRCRARPPTQ